MQEAPVPARNQVTAIKADTHLRGPWLVAVRVAWIAVVGLALVALVVAVPVFYQAQRTILTPETQLPDQLTLEDLRLIEQWGLSLDFYAAYQTAMIAIFSLVLTTAAALIFWHKSVDRIALFVSLWFPIVALSVTPLLEPLIRAHPMWQLPVRFLQGAGLGCFPILTYVFPDGRFVPRWTRALTLAWIVWIVISPFTPFGVAESSSSQASPLWFVVLIPGGMIIGILAQIYRYLRVSSRVERQQTKWVLFGFSVMTIGFVLANLPPLVLPSVLEPGLARVLYLTFGGQFLGIIAICLWLLCIGIGILRHRLWDIDQLINRALVYGALTTSLAIVYIGSVVLLRYLLVPLTGSSQLAIVASTLAIAVLFNPVRRGIQTRIDKRFYRRKYDAARVLAAFGVAARDETDLNALTDELVQVVGETMQPEFVSLWLRDPQARSTTEATRPGARPPR
jgi:uncharacterized membrane protein